MFESYQDGRNFNVPPQQLLAELLALSEYAHFGPALYRYTQTLREAEVDEANIARVEHAVASYLVILLQQGQPYLAQFLLPPTVNPYEEVSPDDPKHRLLIAHWEAMNQDKTDADVLQVATMIKDYPRQSERIQQAVTFLSQGSMFSEKTLRLLMIVKWLQDRGWEGQVVPLVADAMEEGVIQTRVGGRPHSEVKHTWELPAIRVGVAEAIAQLDSGDLGPGDLVVIDEVSFIAFGAEACAQLYAAIQRANERGIFVYATGLATDFRGIPLDFSANLDGQISNLQTASHNAFYAYRHQNTVVSGNEETFTFRIDHVAGFGDLLLRVAISRVHSWMVRYTVAPPFAHPFIVLRDYDNEAYEQLLAAGAAEGEKLFQYYRQHHTPES